MDYMDRTEREFDENKNNLVWIWDQPGKDLGQNCQGFVIKVGRNIDLIQKAIQKED